MSTTDFDPLRRTPSETREILTPAQQFQRVLETPVVPLIGMVALFLASFGNLVNVAIDKDSVELDTQVLAKLGVLAICGIYGMYGFLTERKVQRLILTLPVMWIVIIIGLFFLAVPSSIMQTESFASAVSIACVLLMTVTCLVQLGAKTVLNTVFHAISMFVVLSWVAYFFYSEIGVFAEEIGDDQFQVRMSGLAHPNTLGQFSGLLIVIGCILWGRYQLISKWRIAVVLLAAAALIGSLSRTSMLATLIAIAVIYRQQILKRQYFVLLVGLGMIGSVGLMWLSLTSGFGDSIEGKLAFLSKSGDAEEIFSATGRAEIWAYVISMIGERPLTGYGATTSKFYLSDYSLYTHNMILNVAFSCGVLGGLAAVCMCLGRIRVLLTRYNPLADGLLAFILVNGLFENVIFSNLAGMPTIVWIIAICLPGLQRLNEEDSDPSLNGIAATETTSLAGRPR